MDAKTFFTSPSNSSQKRYEALKAFYCGGLSSNDILQQFSFSSSYFKKVRSEFIQSLKNGINPFFETKKTGPKARRTQGDLIEKIVLLRKRNFSITGHGQSARTYHRGDWHRQNRDVANAGGSVFQYRRAVLHVGCER